MTEPVLDEWIPITTHELFYLLSLAEGPENTASRTHLGLIEQPDNVDMLLAGASTLVVRGLANLSNDLAEPVDQTAVLAWLLSTAHTWVEVGVTVGDVSDALLTVANDEVAAVLAPAKLGIFRFVIVDSGAGVAGTAKAFVQGVFDHNAQAAVSVRRITAAESDPLERHFPTVVGEWSGLCRRPLSVSIPFRKIVLEPRRSESWQVLSGNASLLDLRFSL